jgi:predicted NBD/HSP70 family sugar kinase
MAPVTTKRTKSLRRVELNSAPLASSQVVRDLNRDIVLEILRTRQPISRADLARQSGLQPSTVSAIAEQLLREGWISEGAAARTPRGRRPTLLSLDASMVIVAADIRPTHASIAVIDLNGRVLARETVPLLRNAARAIHNLCIVMQRLIAQFPDKSFEGVGLSLPGRVDPLSQQLLLAPNLPWQQFDIKGAIEEAIQLPVEMDNAANACLLSELWFGRMDGVRNAVLVTISEGIGAAILANGQLYTGQSGLAGEFGHVPLDPNGPPCGCGRHGCWEVFASSRATVDWYMAQQPAHPGSAPQPANQQPTIMELLNMAEDGDTDALAALERQARMLGRGLCLIATILSPQTILLTGGLTAAWERYRTIVETELAEGIFGGQPPRLTVTSDVELARLRGAAALVLQRHSGIPRSRRARPAAKSRTRQTATS